MIVVDSSALLAIYLGEPEGPGFARLIVSSDAPVIGAPNFLEASMVVEARHGEAGTRELDRLVASLDLRVVAFEPSHVQAAREAYRRYGKGRHAAGLNFGDCCAYALAKSMAQPLLFKGDDFPRTDIKAAT